MFFLSLFSYLLSAALRLWTISDSEPGNSSSECKEEKFLKTQFNPHSCGFSHLQSLRHTLREGNAAADFLVKKSALGDSSLVILNEASPDMAFVLFTDVMSVEFVRP